MKSLRDVAVERVELGLPALLRVGQPEPGVDEQPAVVAGDEIGVDVPGPHRQRQRHAPNPGGKLHERRHGTHRRTLPRPCRWSSRVAGRPRGEHPPGLQIRRVAYLYALAIFMSGTVETDMHAAAELIGTTDVEGLSAEGVIEVMLERLHPNLALACSFQKEESVISTSSSRASRTPACSPSTRTFSSPRPMRSGGRSSSATGSRSRSSRGPRSGGRPRSTATRCGRPTPISAARSARSAPLTTALAGLDGWITGVRRDQSATRAATRRRSAGTSSTSCGRRARSPTGRTTMSGRYLREHDLPVNALHERGYASIGCTHCTHPGIGREGRWVGNDKTECGLHA